MKAILGIIGLIVVAMLISGCPQPPGPETQYVCPDQTVVSDASECITDCGTISEANEALMENAVNCFMESFSQCKRAKLVMVEYSGQRVTEVLGMNEATGKCKLKVVLDLQVEEENPYYGYYPAEAICEFSTDVNLLSSEVNNLLADPAYCTGSLQQLYQRQIEDFAG